MLSSHQQEHLIGNAYNIRIFGTWFAYAMANVVRREQCRPLRQLPTCDSSSSDEEDAENLLSTMQSSFAQQEFNNL